MKEVNSVEYTISGFNETQITGRVAILIINLAAEQVDYNVFDCLANYDPRPSTDCRVL